MARPTASGPPSRPNQERYSERYFELSNQIEQAKATGSYRDGIRAARETYQLLPAFVDQYVRDMGAFSIVTSHAVHTGSSMMAVMGEREGIAELRQVLQAVPELHAWLPVAEEAERDLHVVEQILTIVAERPGLAQAQLKRTLGAADGRRLATLASWLEKAGRLRRVKAGSSYQLFPAGYAIPVAVVSLPHPPDQPAPLASVPAMAPRAHAPRSPAQARQIDLENLPYLRLPKAPPRWEARQQAEGAADSPAAAPSRQAGGVPPSEAPAASKGGSRFMVEGEGWRLVSEEKLAPSERPDPAYKDVFPTAGSMYWLDPKGHRADFPDAAAVLRVTDRQGAMQGERGLAHDTCRSDVNTDGSAILFLSRQGVLHGYSSRLDPLLIERLEDLPEYQAQATRLGIAPHELKNHVRCVAISADGSWYLVTIVDEAWCLSTATREVRWGLRFPTQEGWTRVVTPRSDRTGTSHEVEAALRLMELAFPVTPDDISRQYRALAMRWHPDRSPGDPLATARFQQLGAAVELLTGADLGNLQVGEVERVTYERILLQDRLDLSAGRSATFTVSMVMGEKQAADWIYAANAGVSGDRAFLATYSGKIVEVTGLGIPGRVIDIGAVPRQIIETRAHLYVLTDTRLYVLAGERLEALVDVFDQGDLIVGDTGFGLLQGKAFTWYTPTGCQVGSVRSKDPIRRVVSAQHGLVIETRQHRALLTGPGPWW